jgi:pilus assembly protein CpaE
MLAQAMQMLALESGCVSILKTIPDLPETPYEVARLVSQVDPELVLVDGLNSAAGARAAQALRAHAPNIAVMLFADRMPAECVAECERFGVEVTYRPFSPSEFSMAVRAAVYRARNDLLRNMHVFLPGKAGSGATTLAMNVASMLPGLSKTALLLEGDMHSGVLSILMGVEPRVALIDALHNSAAIDYSQWTGYVVHVHDIDLLATDRKKKLPLPTWVNYHQLLRFAAPRYDGIFVDLPEVVNDATADLVHYAASVNVVCTPELPSLKLAAQRLAELENRGVPADRLQVVINRWHRGDISPKEVENMLNARIAAVIPNDYKTIQRNIIAGRPVKADSDLGRAYLDLAKQLLARAAPIAAPAGAGFWKGLRSLAS